MNQFSISSPARFRRITAVVNQLLGGIQGAGKSGDVAAITFSWDQQGVRLVITDFRGSTLATASDLSSDHQISGECIQHVPGSDQLQLGGIVLRDLYLERG